MTTVYIAGAWVEQHQRARPMLARVREAGLQVTCDWTVAEGDVCACGHHRSVHTRPDMDRTPRVCGGGIECSCSGFNGIGVGGDSKLMPADRRKYALADLRGVLSADIVWLLACNTQGATGSWVELGAALAAREVMGAPLLVVSGAKWARTIFTEPTVDADDSDEWCGPDAVFANDDDALAWVIARSR